MMVEMTVTMITVPTKRRIYIDNADHGPGSEKVRDRSCFSQLDKSPNLTIIVSSLGRMRES